MLAAQSVNYAQAVTPHPFGPFARAALLTGVPSPANGVRDYFDPLPGNARTIAHVMCERGYTTAWFGPWHLGPRDSAMPLVSAAAACALVPEAQRGGFAYWEGSGGGFQLNAPWLHGTALPEPVQFPGYQADVLVTRAGDWLAAKRAGRAPRTMMGAHSTPLVPAHGARPGGSDGGRPWFCVVSLESPHPPYAAPVAGVAPLDPASFVLAANVPRGGEVEVRARRELAGYYAHLAATDRALGRLIAALDEGAGRADEAHPVIVFTSLHGDMHGAHGRFRKGWPHEESVRVPLLVRHPAQAPRRSDEPVSLLDLPAMSVAWAEGRDWTSPAGRAAVEISMPSVVALPHQCDRVWSGTRAPARKTVRGPDGGPWLEFDLATDPLELRNLNG